MKQVTAILLGAGQRGAEAYATYALQFPNELKFVGVAEPREARRAAFCAAHAIPPENCATSWEELLSRPKMADCALVCTQDRMHVAPALQALETGYHVLCEKPISPERDELLAIGEKAEQSGRVLSIAHVLRYSPFFTQLKKLLDAGAIGQLVSIQHSESVGYWHCAHSFVRGNWRRSDETSPMILAKCCHDMDILLWLAGSRCTSVSSYGGLAHFNAAHRPKDAPERCTDGCPHRDGCPYYAPRFYLEHPDFVSVLTLDQSREGVLRALETGPYGRCVYRCDNDVVDHQVVNLQYANGVTAGMSMCAFTDKCERIITLMGSHGQIKGNMEENRLELHDFVTGHQTIYDLHVSASGHSGSDAAMMREFVALVAANGAGRSLSDVSVSIESHLVALAAEESRLRGGVPVEP